MPEESHPPKFEFAGNLARTPLPEILATIHRYKAPGVIECKRDSVSKQIHIDDGNIIFANSSLRTDSLGDRLLARGAITQEQYDESARRLGEGKRQGTILVEMHAIDPKNLFIEVRDQVQAIAWSIFEWEDGSVSFRPGRDRNLEFIKLTIPIPRAVLQGARSIRDARRLIARIGTRTTILERSVDHHADLTLLPDEQALLEHVDGRTALGELTAIPPHDPSTNARLLYGLFALKMIRVKDRLKVQVAVGGPK
ncbi:MAG TPA: DUF4388 domain-containing protein [Thermoanaerobaculia bacterium]|nr:DUF4388 domain-containing protein [Thermoanaerobaculia bacterium]